VNDRGRHCHEEDDGKEYLSKHRALRGNDVEGEDGVV
jgi:hypothetical protein